MKKKVYSFLVTAICHVLVFLCIVSASGCNRKLTVTSVKVNDSIRHYYPIVAGQKLVLDYEITNTGNTPLVISEIQTTCGCIIGDDERNVIPEGRKAILNFEYDSSKNIGYVAHEILLYGNFDSTSVCKLYFDVNVVPNSDYTMDYEELYSDYLNSTVFTSEKEENRKNRKNYYVDGLAGDR